MRLKLDAFVDADLDPCFESYRPHLVELNKIVLASSEPLEGNICHFNLEVPLLDKPDPRYQYKRYNFGLFSLCGLRLLEIGFNAGHSALLALTCNPDLVYTGVDIADHTYTIPCYQYLREVFGRRIQLLVGDSRELVPTFPDLSGFDLYHIDGGHDIDVADPDLRNIISRARPGSCILCDDMTGLPLRILCDYYALKGLISEFRPAVWKGPDQALFRVNCPDRPWDV